jgi:isopentenyl diphosphate isomerase/L-lactate dehydrogenase-like FMN-dependent dehydrogenase
MAARITLTDVEALAGARLDPAWCEYFAGGAGAERTLRANVEAFARCRLRPRVLAGIERASGATTVLGHELAAPLVVAPVAYMRRAHADGEEGMARAAAAVGCGMCLSSYATASPAAVAAAAPGLARWLQVYTFRDRGVTDDLVAEALEAGFTALVLTVDLPVLGSRDRERRIDWSMPEDDVPAMVRARAHGLDGEWVDVADPTLDWAYVEHLVSRFGVPVAIKGVVTAEDTVLAVEHGASAVVVSNHGGRQLDLAPATIDVLPEVVEAADGRLEVLLDGGIRRGSDVLVALALGAHAVLAGRMPLWGLAADGEQGAAEVLRLLVEEIEVGLHLLGCRSPADVGGEHVAPRTPGTIGSR